MTSRQFKLHIAGLLERKRQEEAAAERARTTSVKSSVKPVKTSRQPEAPVIERKPPAAVYEPKIMFRIRRSK